MVDVATLSTTRGGVHANLFYFIVQVSWLDCLYQSTIGKSRWQHLVEKF